MTLNKDNLHQALVGKHTAGDPIRVTVANTLPIQIDGNNWASISTTTFLDVESSALELDNLDIELSDEFSDCKASLDLRMLSNETALGTMQLMVKLKLKGRGLRHTKANQLIGYLTHKEVD